MSKGAKKKIFRNNLKVERNEVKNFDRNMAKLHSDFNNFMFNGGGGSFIQFDAEYRNLAKKDYKFIKPDPLYFYKFAIEKNGTDNTNYSPKFNWPISFEKAPNTRMV